MKISEGTVLAHAKRDGWTQQIQVATHQQSDAITPVQSVPQSLAAILQEHERETKLSLARSARRMAKDAEQATGSGIRGTSVELLSLANRRFKFEESR